VLSPGQPSGLYHSEANQEDFLVLAGACLLLSNVAAWAAGDLERIALGLAYAGSTRASGVPHG